MWRRRRRLIFYETGNFGNIADTIVSCSSSSSSCYRNLDWLYPCRLRRDDDQCARAVLSLRDVVRDGTAHSCERNVIGGLTEHRSAATVVLSAAHADRSSWRPPDELRRMSTVRRRDQANERSDGDFRRAEIADHCLCMFMSIVRLQFTADSIAEWLVLNHQSICLLVF